SSSTTVASGRHSSTPCKRFWNPRTGFQGLRVCTYKPSVKKLYLQTPSPQRSKLDGSPTTRPKQNQPHARSPAHVLLLTRKGLRGLDRPAAARTMDVPRRQRAHGDPSSARHPHWRPLRPRGPRSRKERDLLGPGHLS